MQILNTYDCYGAVAKLFHWLMAILIIGMLALGLYMTGLPSGAEKIKFYGWHKELGMLILGLIILRLGWRVGNINPLLPQLPTWQKFSAHFLHWMLYAFMIFIPLSGWMMSSSAGYPISFFGLFVVPDFVLPNEESRILFAEIHEWLAYGLIAAIIIHVAAALQHHFINKDNILRRMLP